MNILTEHPVQAAKFGVVLICGVLMLIFALGPKAVVLERWGRITFAILAVSIMAWSPLAYISTLYGSSLSEVASWRIEHGRYWVSGFAVGTFFALVISGQFIKLFRRSGHTIDEKARTHAA